MATATYNRGERTSPPATERYGTRRTFTETKSFFKTSEFIVWLAATAAVLVVTYMNGSDSLSSWHGWLLVTVLATGYMFSRGIAKAGSREPYREDY